VKPAPFDYERPGSVGEAVEILAERGGHASPLAGGQSLVPLMNLRHAQPRLVVDINHLLELSGLSFVDGELVIGAMVRQRELEQSPLVRERCPLLSHAMAHVGTPQTRNRGTVGGSAGHADPNAELVTVMIAVEATVTLRSRETVRVLPASEFFHSPFHTARRSDELIVEVRVPETSRWAFHELASPTRAPATVAVAMVADDQLGGVVAGVSGIEDMQIKVSRLEDLDGRGTDRYRRAVARALFRRCERDLELRTNEPAGQ
jgi:carbon-monoxide dehydrogenase medium subunit